MDIRTCLTHKTLQSQRRLVAMVMMAPQVMRMTHLVGLRKRGHLCSLVCSWPRCAHTHMLTRRQTDTQTDRHTDRQTHRQTDRQTHSISMPAHNACSEG